MTRFPPALQGAVYMMLAAASWTVMLILVRALGDAYSTFEVLFVRNLVTVAFIVPLLVGNRGAAFRTRRMPLHCTRVVFAYVGILGLFYGLIHIPVADVVALSFTQPLFIAVLAAVMLGEAVGIARWRAVAIGFAGVLVILRPGFEEIGFATLAVLASAAAYGVSNICIKRLMTTDTPVQSTLYGNLLMLPLSALPAAFVWVTPGFWDALAMIGVGLGGMGGIYFVSRAYAAADASAVVPYDFLRLPLSAGAAFLLFGETSDIWMLLGAAIIFASSYALVRIETRAAKAG